MKTGKRRSAGQTNTAAYPLLRHRLPIHYKHSQAAGTPSPYFSYSLQTFCRTGKRRGDRNRADSLQTSCKTGKMEVAETEPIHCKLPVRQEMENGRNQIMPGAGERLLREGGVREGVHLFKLPTTTQTRPVTDLRASWQFPPKRLPPLPVQGNQPYSIVCRAISRTHTPSKYYEESGRGTHLVFGLGTCN